MHFYNDIKYDNNLFPLVTVLAGSNNGESSIDCFNEYLLKY